MEISDIFTGEVVFAIVCYGVICGFGGAFVGIDRPGVSQESLMREHCSQTGQYWNMQPEQQVANEGRITFTEDDILRLPTYPARD